MLPNSGHGLPSGGYPNKRYIAEIVVVDAVATAQTAGLTLQNRTAAAAGAQQYSPMMVLEGQGWKTDAVAASQKVEWAFQNRPVQGAANPTSVLDFLSQINSAGWTKPMTLTSDGVLTTLGAIIAGGPIGFQFSGDADTGLNNPNADHFTLVAGNSSVFGVRRAAGVNKIGFFGTVEAAQGTAVADAAGGATIDAEARTAINALLARCRTYGFIAT